MSPQNLQTSNQLTLSGETLPALLHPGPEIMLPGWLGKDTAPAASLGFTAGCCSKWLSEHPGSKSCGSILGKRGGHTMEKWL